jgi:hypothetical protein
MPHSAFYVLEKLTQAIYALATGAGGVHERLSNAALYFWPAHPEDIPYEDLRRTFSGIRDDLHFEPAKGDEGRMAATLRITSDEDAAAIAQRIVGLYLELNDRLRLDRKGG